MKRFLGILLCIVLAVSIVGCGDSSLTSDEVKEDTEETMSEETTISEEEVEIVSYADDKVVNEFIIAYNDVSESDFTEINKGNIRTKYFACSYGYYCELLNSNATDKIDVTINETNENADAGVEGMRDIFRDIVKTIDPTLEDDDIYNCFEQLVMEDYLQEGVVLGSMKITFCPDKELSNGHSRGHIEIAAQ